MSSKNRLSLAGPNILAIKDERIKELEEENKALKEHVLFLEPSYAVANGYELFTVFSKKAATRD